MIAKGALELTRSLSCGQWNQTQWETGGRFDELK